MIIKGKTTAGVFSNNTELVNKLKIASEEVLEPIWHLPINEEHREVIKGKVSDLNNVGKDRYGGASTAAAFLEKFVEKETEWAHLDIAG
jgi:leucyl aminopeptidase